jgi:hypothetical protein
MRHVRGVLISSYQVLGGVAALTPQGATPLHQVCLTWLTRSRNAPEHDVLCTLGEKKDCVLLATFLQSPTCDSTVISNLSCTRSLAILYSRCCGM